MAFVRPILTAPGVYVQSSMPVAKKKKKASGKPGKKPKVKK